MAAFVGIMVLMPGLALAYEIKGGQDNYTIGKDEVIDDDVLVGGGTVTVDGTINGDLMAAGANVTINGDVNGTVRAAGSTVIINGVVFDDLVVGGGTVSVKGEVVDDLIVAGGSVIVEGEVRDNAMMAGGILDIANGARVGRDLLIGGGMVSISGEVKRNVTFSAGQLNVTGRVGGNLTGEADEKVTIGPDAVINGNLEYKAPAEADIESGAEVMGNKQWTPVEETVQKASYAANYLGKIYSVLALIATAIVVVLLFPKYSMQLAQNIETMPGKSIGYGIIVLILTPVIVLFLAMTLLGIPMAAIIFGLYLMVLYLSKIFVGLWIGKMIVKPKGDKRGAVVGSAVLGVLILSILMVIPFLGFLVKLAAVMFGLGALVICIKDYGTNGKTKLKPAKKQPAAKKAA